MFDADFSGRETRQISEERVIEPVQYADWAAPVVLLNNLAEV